MNEFAKDYQMGSEFEERLCKLLQKRYPSATRIGSKFSDYDIFIAETNIKVECKYDAKSKDTGNVFIELKDNDNTSGILKSKSDYYYIDTGVKLYCIPLMKIFECLIIEQINPTKHSVDNGSYDREMTGCIVPIEKLEKYSIQTQPTLMKFN